jgi:hypothetical protein
MGYLDNSSITVDAILTKKGRELLAKGRDSFKITQFALADDEIDYNLWNPAHPLGSSYYGIIIENMPLVEALPDESQTMKYKLVTLPRKTARIPVIQVGQSSIILTSPGQNSVITPTTVNYDQANNTYGYTAILADSDVATLTVTRGVSITGTAQPTMPSFYGDTNQSVSAVGLEFRVTAKQQLVSDKSTTLTIVGNETGGRVVVNLTVRKTNIATSIGTNSLDASL